LASVRDIALKPALDRTIDQLHRETGEDRRAKRRGEGDLREVRRIQTSGTVEEVGGSCGKKKTEE
jgi:hypothetical protein